MLQLTYMDGTKNKNYLQGYNDNISIDFIGDTDVTYISESETKSDILDMDDLLLIWSAPPRVLLYIKPLYQIIH